MANNPINVRLLKTTILTQASKKIADLADPAINKQFDLKKEKFLEEFDRHLVTEELNRASDDPTASSYFLPAGHGNLFSFLGFNQGEKPALVLREHLNDKIKPDPNKKSRKTTIKNDQMIVTSRVLIPTLTEVNDAMAKQSPLQWSPGRSWTEHLSRGITGFGQFVANLFKSPKPSRSGGGIQHPGKDKQLSGSIGKIRYVDELLARFKELIGK